MLHPRLLVVAAAVTLWAAAANAETLRFHATMNGQTEVPPKTTSGAGTVDATFDTTTKKLTYSSSWHGLSGPATMAHFHGPAEPGANAKIAVSWGDDPTSPFTSTATLTDQQAADLIAGRWYANVHTAQNPTGEIRGQMIRE